MNYYNEIESIIKRNTIKKKVRQLEESYDTIKDYWEIGKLIIEAQGGIRKAKYGNELIKKWSKKYTLIYGNGYNYTNMTRFRQFYITFPKLATVWQQLTWSKIKVLLPIKDENKRNYYINLCIEKNLSTRELVSEIKSESFERLKFKPDNIEILAPKAENDICSSFKDPIIIKKSSEIKSEKDLETTIIAQIEYFCNQLGSGFAFLGSEYKIIDNNRNYYIDILLFNINYNCYVVVELKLRKLKIEDKVQVELYMNKIDNTIKKPFHNKTIGIIITKEQDKFIANLIANNNIYSITYQLQ